jgi:hypothetical protein
MIEGPYTKTGRLADVLALIQVLALDPYPQRKETGIARELQGAPASATDWFALAKEHRELFRVNIGEEAGLSLVARYVLPHGEGQQRLPLAPDFVSALLQTAITLHDRQVDAADRWKSFMPLWAALIGGILGTLSTLATLWLKGGCK